MFLIFFFIRGLATEKLLGNTLEQMFPGDFYQYSAGLKEVASNKAEFNLGVKDHTNIETGETVSIDVSCVPISSGIAIFSLDTRLFVNFPRKF